MGRIAIVTDSNSGITQEEAHELGVHVIAMPVIVDEKTYFEGIDIDKKQFYKKLKDNIHITTSQPLPGDIIELWSDLLNSYDSIIYIPMSSSLSRSYETSVLLANKFSGKVHVVNNRRISATQRQSVIDAIELVDAGISALEIKYILEEDQYSSTIYITVDTLEYLKKGGRITPTVAAIATILKIKPVLQFQGDLLDTFAKVRTVKVAKKVMINALKDDIINRFNCNNKENEIMLMVAHTDRDKEAEIMKRELQDIFPDYPVYVGHLPLSIACHTGPGALGVGAVKKLNVEAFNIRERMVVG